MSMGVANLSDDASNRIQHSYQVIVHLVGINNFAFYLFPCQARPPFNNFATNIPRNYRYQIFRLTEDVLRNSLNSSNRPGLYYVYQPFRDQPFKLEIPLAIMLQ